MVTETQNPKKSHTFTAIPPWQAPNTEDVRKIHAEINQLVNQRFLMVTAGVTLAGIAAKWVLPENTPTPGSAPGIQLTLACSVLSVAFTFLAVLGYRASQMIRVFSTYLIVSETSQWEMHWRQYRVDKREYPGYAAPYALMYVMLFLFAGLTAPAFATWYEQIQRHDWHTWHPFIPMAISFAGGIWTSVYAVGAEHDDDKYEREWQLVKHNWPGGSAVEPPSSPGPAKAR
jgi:hypothetical protein